MNKNSGHIYVIKSELGHKIGRTKSLPSRMSIFGVQLPFEWSVIFTMYVDDCNKIERMLHNKYSSKRLNGEWFRLDESDIEETRTLCAPHEVEEPSTAKKPWPKKKGGSYKDIETDLTSTEFLAVLDAMNGSGDGECDAKEEIMETVTSYIDEGIIDKWEIDAGALLNKLISGDTAYHASLKMRMNAFWAENDIGAD